MTDTKAIRDETERLLQRERAAVSLIDAIRETTDFGLAMEFHTAVKIELLWEEFQRHSPTTAPQEAENAD